MTTIRSPSIAAKLFALVAAGMLVLGVAVLLVVAGVLRHDLETQIIDKQRLSMTLAWSILSETGGRFSAHDGALYLDGARIDGNTMLVDRVAQYTQGAATIFLDDVRIATTVRHADGTRALGTRLDHGPAREAVFGRGESFRGVVQILGEPYYAAYDPIRSDIGDVVGILFVGLKASDVLQRFEHNLRLTALGGAAFALAVAAVVLWSLQRLLTPLGALRQLMTQLAEGDVSTTIPGTNRSDEVGAMARAVLVFRDSMIRHVQAERTLERTNRALLALAAGNRAMLTAKDRPTLLAALCHNLAEDANYPLVWIATPEHDCRRSVRVAAYAGEHRQVLNDLTLTWDDTPFGRSAPGMALRTGAVKIVHDFLSEEEYQPWRPVIEAHGLRSCIAIPIRDGADVVAALTVCSFDVEAFGGEEGRILETLGADLAYALHALASVQRYHTAEEGRLSALARLQKTFEQSVSALAQAVEKRDPYTAGHSLRVAHLAEAIAREMGLAKERVEGIRLGALMHDIGKIGVPIDLLTKPDKLLPEEFETIKCHPAIGAEIIGTIHFDQPIARMVGEHHERLDGSGYPSGLMGDAICLEARIVAVADVVEAVSARRPYHPARGLDMAAEIIIAESGTRLDGDVVDACLRLLATPDFALGPEQVSGR